MTPWDQNRGCDRPIRLSDGAGAPDARNIFAPLGLKPGFARFGALPPARQRTTQTPCCHTRHVGTCRHVQPALWRRQLAHVNGAGPACGKEVRR